MGGSMKWLYTKQREELAMIQTGSTGKEQGAERTSTELQQAEIRNEIDANLQTLRKSSPQVSLATLEHRRKSI